MTKPTRRLSFMDGNAARKLARTLERHADNADDHGADTISLTIPTMDQDIERDPPCVQTHDSENNLLAHDWGEGIYAEDA